MRIKRFSFLQIIFALSDILLLNICLLASYYLTNKYSQPVNKNVYISSAFISTLIWIFTTFEFRLYSEYTIHKLRDINKSTWRSLICHIVFFYIFIYLTNFSFPGNFISGFYLLAVICLFLSRISSSIFKNLLKFDCNNRKAAVLAIAAVGGHWIQLLRLMPLFEEHNVTFVSNNSDQKNTVKGYRFYTVPDANRTSKLNLIRSGLSVLWFVLVLRPQIIISTGGAPGLAAIALGKLFGAKTIWIDSVANAEKLSLSGNIASKIADRVYTQWEYLATKNIIFSGNIFT